VKLGRVVLEVNMRTNRHNVMQADMADGHATLISQSLHCGKEFHSRQK